VNFPNLGQPITKGNEFLGNPLGMLRFLCRYMEKLFAKLRVMHLFSMLPKFFRMLSLIEISLAQDIESRTSCLVTNAKKIS
jgi:hypothetical protein